MSHASLLIYSSLSIITAGLVSLVIFLLSFKNEGRLHKSSLRQWSLAFFMFTWIRIPTVLVAAGVVLTASRLVPFYVVTTTASIIAYLLFYRGSVSLHTKNKFLTNTLPILLFIFLFSLVLLMQFAFNASTISIIYIMSTFYYLVILLMITLGIKFLWQKFAFLPNIAKIGIVFIVVGWVKFLVFNTYILQGMRNYPEDLWFTALIDRPFIYLGFTIAHLFLIIGFIFGSYHKEIPESDNQKVNKNFRNP